MKLFQGQKIKKTKKFKEKKIKILTVSAEMLLRSECLPLTVGNL